MVQNGGQLKGVSGENSSRMSRSILKFMYFRIILVRLLYPQSDNYEPAFCLQKA